MPKYSCIILNLCFLNGDVDFDHSFLSIFQQVIQSWWLWGLQWIGQGLGTFWFLDNTAPTKFPGWFFILLVGKGFVFQYWPHVYESCTWALFLMAGLNEKLLKNLYSSRKDELCTKCVSTIIPDHGFFQSLEPWNVQCLQKVLETFACMWIWFSYLASSNPKVLP